MAQFTDKLNTIWQVSLDPVIADEIKQDHAIEIVSLAADPLLKLRTDTAILCAVMLVICRDQITDRGLTREQFLKRIPFPPDAMLTAIEESIVSFFPTGRHSHAREVLASYANMASKTDELTTAKMSAMVSNPETMRMVSDQADREIAKAMKALTDSQLGT